MCGHMEISVYQWFQVPSNHVKERLTQASQNFVYIVFSLIAFAIFQELYILPVTMPDKAP